MSDIVSALPGAAYEGYVRVEELGLRGMITLRGDLASTKLKATVKEATGQAVPKQGQVNVDGDSGVAWMSPDELLVMVPYAEIGTKLAQIEGSLKGQHFLAVNVSDARAVFGLSGARVREVMAKLCPVDMSEAGFAPGQFRRTRMAQIPAAFWMTDAQNIQIVCFRSVAEYAFNLLKDAAEPGGEVGLFA